jgi:hypothetical protein
MIQWGIEPATFRLVAQCLNQRRHYRVRVNQLRYETFPFQRKYFEFILRFHLKLELFYRLFVVSHLPPLC